MCCCQMGTIPLLQSFFHYKSAAAIDFVFAVFLNKFVALEDIHKSK